MRTFSLLASAATLVLVLGIEPGDALDGKPSSPQTPTLAMSPVDAMRNATEALKTGEKNRAVISLQYAAEHGQGFALWKLGRMYADGDGVARTSRNSPTATPTKTPRSRGRALSPTPSWRSATIIWMASPTPP